MAADVLRYRLQHGSKFKLALSLLFLFMGLEMAMRSSNDFLIYFHKAWGPLSQGIGDIYEPERAHQGGYYYSPLFALSGIPLSWLSSNAAVVINYFLYVLMALAGWVFIRRILRYSDLPVSSSAWVAIIGYLSLMNQHLGQALTGNISAQITFLMLASFYFYSLGHIKSAAVLLALAINFKVYPAFLLLYFIYKRDFRFIGWLIFFGLLSLGAPALYVGWSENISMHQQQLLALSQYGPQNDLGRLSYQSLSAFFVRSGRLIGIDDMLSLRAAQGLGALFLLGCFYRWGFTSVQRQSYHFCLTLLVLGLIAPASWVHHFGFVYAPAIVLALGYMFSPKKEFLYRVHVKRLFALLAAVLLIGSDLFDYKRSTA